MAANSKANKIAFFITSPEAGGIERYLLRFLSFYKDKIDATVYCKKSTDGALANEYKEVGVTLKTFKIGKLGFKRINELKQEFVENEYDAVVDFNNNFAAFTLLAAKRAGINTRITWYRNAEEKFKRTPLRLLYNKIINKITFKTATHILSNSKAAFNHFYKGYDWQNDSRFQVIYNGIKAEDFINIFGSLREEFNIPADAFVIGHVGRYNEQKNHDTIIQVAFELCAMHPNFYFILCGKGVEDIYKQTVQEKGFEDRIIMPGVRNDIPQVLNTYDCFFFPSTIEGNPNALIEAMIAGLPIVASNIEPIKEATPIESHAYLKEPYDVDGFVKHIESIYNSSKFAQSLIYQDWAIKAFDYKERFEEFYKLIE